MNRRSLLAIDKLPSRHLETLLQGLVHAKVLKGAELNHLALQKTQAPARMSCGRFGADQSDQPGFLLAVENPRNGRPGPAQPQTEKDAPKRPPSRRIIQRVMLPAVNQPA